MNEKNSLDSYNDIDSFSIVTHTCPLLTGEATANANFTTHTKCKFSYQMIRSFKFLWSSGSTVRPLFIVNQRKPVTLAAMHHVARVTSKNVVPSFVRPPFHKRQSVRTVFIQTENTPNPESIKFVSTNRVRSQVDMADFDSQYYPLLACPHCFYPCFLSIRSSWTILTEPVIF